MFELNIEDRKTSRQPNLLIGRASIFRSPTRTLVERGAIVHVNKNLWSSLSYERKDARLRVDILD
jgi:hypothetical protein